MRNEEEAKAKEDLLLRHDPLGYARKLVLRHAEELGQQFQDFEELIAVKGRELDLLIKARDTLNEALHGTEAVRVEIQEALEGPVSKDELGVSEHAGIRYR